MSKKQEEQKVEKNETMIEVRYQETDQMGVVYHANYLVWFEIGRTKLIEQLGFKYVEMEAQGFVSPVIDAHISYKKPVLYGQKVTVETWVKKYDGIRTIYEYQIINDKKEIAVTGTTKHVVVQKDSFKPVILRKVHPKWDHVFREVQQGG